MVFKYLHQLILCKIYGAAGFQVNLPDYNEQGFLERLFLANFIV